VVENRKTEIGPAARLTYHSAVMAGVRVGEDAMLGAMSLATRDVEDHSIAGGVPAKQLKTKDEATQFEDRTDVKAPERIVKAQCD
jgi:acetyltransferase-like isoleucine patch superfamily enzyme